ncbi:MAG: ABC transporter ATP-binding protein/permease [Oscillibacter sp.]|nr:ABC transporter ATP-binding protein/permease [Oscillibacter sp.]
MLKLDNIIKVYKTGSEDVTALRGVSLSFRENEFVAVLGHSGCGKTTLLNIVGGLDQYTSGDLIINGRSTKEFRDGDWDTYRNHSIGFVFQSYNLIPHQSVLANVELALTFSGVGKGERRRRAAEALKKVGLADQMKKRPNQLSGGQMQRVAIARALVNDPDILLADEPTGALDSETSVQVMDLLAEIAREKLVIMVTHNPELAEKYATRTIRLLDGRIMDDSAPFDGGEEHPAQPARRQKKPSMSFFTAFALSLNNLMTKKGRTLLTSFAGSIGIIGIALILSLSTGINSYIEQVQEETLSSYPITIMAESTDMSDLMVSLMGARRGDGGKDHDRERVYSSTVMYDMLNSMIDAEVQTNNLKDFKKFLDQGGGGITDLATVQYSYDFGFDIYTEDEDGEIVKSDVMTLLQTAMSAMYGGDYSSYFSAMGGMYSRMDVWEELLPGNDGETVGQAVKSQYDLLYGAWPESFDEVILFVDRNNEISDLMLYALGLMSSTSMTDSMTAAMSGETLEAEVRSWSYEELCDMDFKLLLPAEKYQYEASTGTYVDMSVTDTGMDFLYNSDGVGTRLRVVGVARPTEESTNGMINGAIGYTSALTTYAIETTAEMDIVREQMADEENDVISGLPFPSEDDVEPTDQEKQDAITEHLKTLSYLEMAAAYTDVMSQPSEEYVETVVAQQMEGMTRESIEQMIIQQYAGEMGVDAETISGYIADMDDETLFARVEEAIGEGVREQYAQGVQAQLGAASQDYLVHMLEASLDGGDPLLMAEPFEVWQFNYLYDNYMPPTRSDSTYEDNLDLLGYVDLESPSTISIYASTFSEKDEVADRIAAYNAGVSEEDEISYTDYVALLMSSITNIISGISYLLIAFVSISLVVSSIMIGIITYISVLERTKEIGILRAVGASKRDVSRVFNAETLIVGLGAGIIGIGVTLLLIIPINAILLHFTGIVGLKAALPAAGAVILVAISALLTIVAGLIPSRVAARKDPVVALRTE